MEEEKEASICGVTETGKTSLARVANEALLPAAKELAPGLALVGKTITAFLSPLKLIIYGFDKVENTLLPLVINKLQGKTEEQLIAPADNIAGPLLERARFSMDSPDLVEMFANLLATAMDKATANTAHPSFVEIIAQLTPTEARMIKRFDEADAFPLIDLVACEEEPKEIFGVVMPKAANNVLQNFSTIPQELGQENAIVGGSYFDNLQRLGIIQIKKGHIIRDTQAYMPLENHADILDTSDQIKKAGIYPHIIRHMFIVTHFGMLFIKACSITDESQTTTSCVIK